MTNKLQIKIMKRLRMTNSVCCFSIIEYCIELSRILIDGKIKAYKLDDAKAESVVYTRAKYTCQIFKRMQQSTATVI